jgi:hypothetical protein
MATAGARSEKRFTVGWEGGEPTRDGPTRILIAVMVSGLQPDLTRLSYDELFERYRAAVAALGQANGDDATRIERDIIVPLNDELTRRSRLRRRG